MRLKKRALRPFRQSDPRPLRATVTRTVWVRTHLRAKSGSLSLTQVNTASPRSIPVATITETG